MTGGKNMANWVLLGEWIAENKSRSSLYIDYVPNAGALTTTDEKDIETEYNLGWHSFVVESDDNRVKVYLASAKATDAEYYEYIIRQSGYPYKHLMASFNPRVYGFYLYSNVDLEAYGQELTMDLFYALPKEIKFLPNSNYVINQKCLSYMPLPYGYYSENYFVCNESGLESFSAKDTNILGKHLGTKENNFKLRPVVALPDDIMVDIGDSERNGKTPETALKIVRAKSNKRQKNCVIKREKCAIVEQLDSKWVSITDWLKEDGKRNCLYINYSYDRKIITIRKEETGWHKHQNFDNYSLETGISSWRAFMVQEGDTYKAYLIPADEVKNQYDVKGLKIEGDIGAKNFKEIMERYCSMYSNKEIGSVGQALTLDLYSSLRGAQRYDRNDYGICQKIIHHTANDELIEGFIAGDSKGLLYVNGIRPLDSNTKVEEGTEIPMVPIISLPSNIMINIGDKKRNGKTPETALEIAILREDGQIERII